MAEYTIELRDVVSHHNIFDFSYPFYDENKRRAFEESFIRHFYFREIGCQTVDRFVWYLKDKMYTVFPYYNELFKTAQIEYSVLDNYNITEQYERSVDRTEKGAGFSSTVGQNFDKHNTESERTQNGEGSSTVNITGQNGEQETTNTETDHVNKTTVDETDNTTTASERSEEHDNDVVKHLETETDGSEVRKFLDTPQGLLDLSESKYLTTLNHDTNHSNVDSDETTNDAGTSSVTENGTNNRTVDREENGEANTITDTTRNLSGNATQNQTGTTTSSDDERATSNYEGEQHTTSDNNTRTESIGNQKENFKLTRRGNIGVDTDADMIQKHINLQRVLQRIELMFFDECEDLFMMVY